MQPDPKGGPPALRAKSRPPPYPRRGVRGDTGAGHRRALGSGAPPGEHHTTRGLNVTCRLLLFQAASERGSPASRRTSPPAPGLPASAAIAAAPGRAEKMAPAGGGGGGGARRLQGHCGRRAGGRGRALPMAQPVGAGGE